MKKVVRLTESDLVNIIKRLVKESYGPEHDESYFEDFKNADDYAGELYMEMDNEIQTIVGEFLTNSNFEKILHKYQNEFIDKYGQYSDVDYGVFNEYITDLMQMGNKDFNYDDAIGDISSTILDNL